jgi:hypothetical protein
MNFVLHGASSHSLFLSIELLILPTLATGHKGHTGENQGRSAFDGVGMAVQLPPQQASQFEELIGPAGENVPAE